jgi:hypothetical protein
VGGRKRWYMCKRENDIKKKCTTTEEVVERLQENKLVGCEVWVCEVCGKEIHGYKIIKEGLFGDYIVYLADHTYNSMCGYRGKKGNVCESCIKCGVSYLERTKRDVKYCTEYYHKDEKKGE